ncbi:MAG TPA: DUF4177 domain-containing protein [Planctomycetota bacterium]|jgi:hypothetical protein
MARVTYSAETKTGILEATRQAREAGKPWAEALDAAKAAGYSGNIKSLYQLMLRDEVKNAPEPLVTSQTPSISTVASALEKEVVSRVTSALKQASAYEYKAVTLTTQESPDAQLNSLGIEGWRLVATVPVSTVLLEDGAQVTRIQYVFRRETSLVK